MTQVKAYAAHSPSTPLVASTIPRRQLTARDVQIQILYCGVCHSDLHYARDEWHDSLPTQYPCVPGHEIVGKVTAVGAAVSQFKAGDVVGVGCLVDSDRNCPHCSTGKEQLCGNMTMTYGSTDPHLNLPTYGGYSESIVVDEHFVLRVPTHLELAGVAPLLCAGITTYSPIRRWGDISGKKVGIVGLGGLGHMGVKFAHAFGAHVVAITSSERKRVDALRLGAAEVLVSSDSEAMARHAGSFAFILDTVSAEHDLNAYLNLLMADGNLTLVGAPEKPLSISAFALLFGRRTLSGSLIGGIAETQEMLDFCGRHNLIADVEVIPVQRINEAFERISRADVTYRFSIDMSSLQSE